MSERVVAEARRIHQDVKPEAVERRLQRLAEKSEPHGKFATVADAAVEMHLDEGGKLLMGRQTKSDEFCAVTDVPSAYTILSLQGPLSRDLLAGIGAQGVGSTHCGLMALECLQLEKGYRDFGVDIDNTDSPLEMDLGFVVDLTKVFIGRDRLAAQKAAGPLPKRLVALRLDEPEPLLIRSEPLLADGAPVGYVRAGAFGHTLGASVGLAVVEHRGGVRKLP